MAQEGQRERKKPTGRPKGSKAIKKYVRTPPEHKIELINTALTRYQNGELLESVAKDLNISRATLYGWMLNEAPDEYKEIQKNALITRLAETYEKIEVASDQLDLARARELRRAAQWDAERRLSRLFAQKQEVSVDVTYAIADKLTAARSRVIDHVASQPLQSTTSHNVIDAEIISEKSKS